MMDPKKASLKMARQMASVRRRKISALKQRIARGKYKVSNAELAKALFMAQ